MLKKSEYKLLEDPYFRVIRKENQFVEFISKNTEHCWNVFINQFEVENRVTLYHKTRLSNRHYDEYGKCKTVKEAISQIKEFDKLILEHQKSIDDKMVCQNTRKLKVYDSSGYNYKSTPSIVLKGEWLRNCGFDSGSEIEVECDCYGKLTIRRVI